MGIRESIGEVGGKQLINIGDNVDVKYYEEGETKNAQGILLEATLEKIKINGTIPQKEINVNDIIEIKKINNSS